MKNETPSNLTNLNRREFCKKSSLFLGSLPVAASLPFLRAENAPPAPAPVSAAAPTLTTAASQPVLQNPTGDGGITFVWAVNGPSTGRVEYGETEALGQMIASSTEGLLPFDDKVLKVRLTGLKPGTQYFYRVVTCPINFKNAYDIKRGTEEPGKTYSFKTLNAAAASTSFSLINDTHETKETLTRLFGMIQAEPTDSLIWDGDIFNEIPTEQHIADQVLNPFAIPYATNIPLILVKGNHDVRGAHARLLDRYCDVPNSTWYYLLRQGPVAFLVMDTGEDKPDDHPVYGGLGDFKRYRSTQQEWLRTAIQTPEFRNAPFRVALLHIPFLWKNYTALGKYCSDGKAKWHDLFVQAKIDLIISGHTHEHAWIPPQTDAPYGQLIGGGPTPKEATLIRGKADQQTLSFTMCDLDGKELASHTFHRQA